VFATCVKAGQTRLPGGEGEETRSTNQRSGEPVRPAEWENMSGVGGEKNVEGETEVKGRTARETARTEKRGAAVGSKSVVCR